MSPIRTLALMLTLACGVAFFYFIGHGLATGTTGPFIGAAILLVVTVIAAVVQLRSRSGRTA